MPRTSLSRRKFLISALLAGSALTAPGVFAATQPKAIPWTPGWADRPQILADARFFTSDEAAAIDAMTARLIPTDNLGPGAREAGVTGFIDRQLAGFFGRGQRWYMQGPFLEGTPEQGLQSSLPPAPLYRRAIAAIDRYCREHHGGLRFAQLPEKEQDAILAGVEKGDIELAEVSGKAFFTLLLENTIEGFFSDPIYGGNRDMVGWRLVGFPGARYDYRPFLNHNGAPISLEPVGLSGRPGWNVR